MDFKPFKSQGNNSLLCHTVQIILENILMPIIHSIIFENNVYTMKQCIGETRDAVHSELCTSSGKKRKKAGESEHWAYLSEELVLFPVR